MALPVIPIAIAALSGGAGFFTGFSLGDTFTYLFWIVVIAFIAFLIVRFM